MLVPVPINRREISQTVLFRRFLPSILGAVLFALTTPAHAGGPRYIAGTSYFDPGVTGQPVHWAGGQVNYYVDQGPLNDGVSNQQATAMIDAAAALWSAIPTAGVTLTDMGPLNEDVNGSNIVVNLNRQITQPADVTASATSYPLAVIFDADGSVIDAVFGATASDPTSCQNNGVQVWMDNINPNATFAHAVILLNGRCATNADLLAMMGFELERAFGRVLGLDYSQVNPGAFSDANSWPVMQPISGACGPLGGACIPNPAVLRYDDIAALNRIYPIDAQNLANFPGKQLTASNTISIQGTIAFRTGMGMQGVNVVARPLDANGNPLYQYTVSFVSGAYFSGNRGNPVTGPSDASGIPFTQWGSNDPEMQGYFDLSGIPLPPGMTSANYQLTFETINPLYILENSVGPYVDGQVSPSGTLQAISVPNMFAGSSQNLNVTVGDSAVGGYQDAIGTQAAPRPMPASGMWVGRLGQIGQSDWFSFPVRGNRMFTVVTQAVDEAGGPTESKALPSIGVWDAFDSAGSTAIGAGPGLNGLAAGETWLRVAASGDDVVRIGIADLRGDGRPDYAYNGWVLYADTVQPARLPASGGPIVIHGMGFRAVDTVLVGGRAALVTSVSPNEITAIAPAAASGVSGSVDVEVDDLPVFYAAAAIGGGLSYDSGTGDALTLVTAPMNTVPIATAIPFTVTALGPDLTPAGGVSVTYTIVSGSATLACGLPVCTVTASGDGRATMNATAADGTWSVVTASLSNGSTVQAGFAGGTAATLTSLSPQLSLAAGAVFTWTVQALALSNGAPASGQSVSWQSAGGGITAQGATAVLTNSSGIATRTLTVGPLAEGQTATIDACLNGTNQCATFSAFGARPEYAVLQAVAGTAQSIGASAVPTPITLRLLDMTGNPMTGGTVALYQALYAWAPPCNPHVVCPAGALLAVESATATSDISGMVAFSPATFPGTATNLQAIAASGNTTTVPITIEQHP
ncbi:MAG TPA: IPT/TIG domain-containing protein [Terracidiphilus sp.]|nr:IPT/TIG domain-containing protein [Terracidiphilus sp.]